MYHCIFAFGKLRLSGYFLQSLEIFKVRGEVSRENHFRDKMFDMSGFIRGISLQEVDLAVFPENIPKLIQVHLF